MTLRKQAWIGFRQKRYPDTPKRGYPLKTHGTGGFYITLLNKKQAAEAGKKKREGLFVPACRGHERHRGAVELPAAYPAGAGLAGPAVTGTSGGPPGLPAGAVWPPHTTHRGNHENERKPDSGLYRTAQDCQPSDALELLDLLIKADGVEDYFYALQALRDAIEREII
jgi:hypothetical protein